MNIPYPSHRIASAWNNILFKILLLTCMQLLHAVHVPVDKDFCTSKDLFESSGSYCQSDTSTWVSKGESTASGVSTDDKTAIQYKPVTSLAGNNALVHHKQSRGYDQISHALSNTHGLYGCSCNFLDFISIYSLNPGKLPGHSLTNGLDTRLGWYWPKCILCSG